MSHLADLHSRQASGTQTAGLWIAEVSRDERGMESSRLLSANERSPVSSTFRPCLELSRLAGGASEEISF